MHIRKSKRDGLYLSRCSFYRISVTTFFRRLADKQNFFKCNATLLLMQAKRMSVVAVPRDKILLHFHFVIPFFGYGEDTNFPLIMQARPAIRVASKVVALIPLINSVEDATKHSPDRAKGAIKLLAYLKYTIQTILVEKRVNPANWLSSHSRSAIGNLSTRGLLSNSQRLEIRKRRLV